MRRLLIAAIILFATVAILVAIDILIRLWFQFDLVFDAATFNNVGTPIIGLVSLVVYLITLLFLIKQNRVIESQSLRPYFEKQIDRIYQLTKEKVFKVEIEKGKVIEYNGLNFTDRLKEIFRELNGNDHYLKDVAIRGKKFTMNYLSSRSYWTAESFISIFTDDFWHLHFGDVKELIKEISAAKLTKDEKNQLKNRIYRELLNEYMFLCRFSEKHPSFFLVTVLSEPDPKKIDLMMDYEFKPLFDTPFSKYYKWFKEHIQQRESS